MDAVGFAFGDNEVDGCSCPAMAAGYFPAQTFVEAYDVAAREVAAVHADDAGVRVVAWHTNLVGQRVPWRGVLPSALAREAWERAMAWHAGEAETGTMERSRDAARRLGWT